MTNLRLPFSTEADRQALRATMVEDYRIAVPHERWGETVKAVVVLQPGVGATEAEIIAFCRGQLGGFELPHSVDFVGALPRTPTGKVLKRVLREPYWTGKERRVAGA